jgi:hypothetical protein
MINTSSKHKKIVILGKEILSEKVKLFNFKDRSNEHKMK